MIKIIFVMIAMACFAIKFATMSELKAYVENYVPNKDKITVPDVEFNILSALSELKIEAESCLYERKEEFEGINLSIEKVDESLFKILVKMPFKNTFELFIYWLASHNIKEKYEMFIDSEFDQELKNITNNSKNLLLLYDCIEVRCLCDSDYILSDFSIIIEPCSLKRIAGKMIVNSRLLNSLTIK